MAKEPVRIQRSEVRTAHDGAKLLILIGKDSIGRPVEMMIPAAALNLFYEQAATTIEASINADQKPIGEYTRSFHREGLPCRIDSTDDGRVLLIARLGLPTETRLVFDRSDASALATELLASVERLPAPPEKH